jgi:prefoldin subunit 5
MDVNKIDAETVKNEIQELKNKKVELENKIITIQQIAARFSIAYGESEEEVDRLLNDIAEINRQIEYLAKNV